MNFDERVRQVMKLVHADEKKNDTYGINAISLHQPPRLLLKSIPHLSLKLK